LRFTGDGAPGRGDHPRDVRGDLPLDGEGPSQAWSPSDLHHVPRRVRTRRDWADGALHGRCAPITRVSPGSRERFATALHSPSRPRSTSPAVRPWVAYSHSTAPPSRPGLFGCYPGTTGASHRSWTEFLRTRGFRTTSTLLPSARPTRPWWRPLATWSTSTSTRADWRTSHVPSTARSGTPPSTRSSTSPAAPSWRGRTPLYATVFASSS
jgi:hypothetical protein